MIEIFTIEREGKKERVVDSYTLYNLMGLPKQHYNRFIKKYKNRGGIDIDWFIDNKLLKLNRRIKNRHFFTLEFARAICIGHITKGSNQLIVFLKEQQNDRSGIRSIDDSNISNRK